MEQILNKLLSNIELATAVVIALGGLIGTIIAQYHKVRKAWAERDYAAIASVFMDTAETDPGKVLATLTNKTGFDAANIQTNAGKALLVAEATNQALIKSNKKTVLQKLGINNAADAVPLITSIYQGLIKPLVKKK